MLTIAAKITRLAAVIAQVPFTDGLASSRTASVGTALRLMSVAIRDAVGALAGKPPVYVPAIGSPGALAAMTAPDCEPGYRKLIPPGLRFDERVAARVFLEVGMYRPITGAARIQAPLLLQVAEHDSLAPAASAKEVARRARRARLEVFPLGQLDVYVGEPFETAVASQVRFLEEVMPSPASADEPAGTAHGHARAASRTTRTRSWPTTGGSRRPPVGSHALRTRSRVATSWGSSPEPRDRDRAGRRRGPRRGRRTASHRGRDPRVARSAEVFAHRPRRAHGRRPPRGAGSRCRAHALRRAAADRARVVARHRARRAHHAREQRPGDRALQSLGFQREGQLEGRIRRADGGLEADIPMGWLRTR